MALTSTRIILGKDIGLNIIESEKFKSNLLTINIIRPLERSEVTMNALLPMVLNQGSSKFPTKLEMERKLESMYGSDLSLATAKRGERQIIKASLEWADSRYTKEDSINLEAIELIKNVIFDPLLEGKSFSSKIIEQEKNNLAAMIKSRINDKRSYAINRCIEEMCRGERFGLYSLGYEEDIDKMDGEKLLLHYEKILLSSPIEIFFIGRSAGLSLETLIPTMVASRNETIVIPRETITSSNMMKNQVVEKLPVEQGKLVLGFRSTIPYEHSLYNGLLLGNEIFGGGPNSHLFKTVREERSLAYYASSSLLKHKSIIITDAGIEFGNYQMTLNLMKEQLTRIKNGDFTEEDIEIAKKSIVTSSQSIVDSNHMISEYFLSKLITNDDRTLEEMISDLRAVNKVDIVAAMNTVSMDIIYFMRGIEEDDNENLE
jgi:predicted Zn-dependent peptidase